MLTTVLLLLLAAVPPAAEATKLAKEKAWDELYLKYSAAAPGEYSEADRKLIAKSLLEAARGMGDDPVLALSLAERSAAFEETSEAWLLAGELGLKLDQNGAAGKALEKAVVLDPKNDRARLLRADLAFEEGDLLLAENLYESVPEPSAQRAAAQAGLAKTRAARATETEHLGQLHKLEKELATRRAAGEKAVEDQPLTLFEVCRAHAVGTCEAIKRCHPELAQGVSDCSEFTMACQGIEGAAPFSRGELKKCTAAIAAADCAKVHVGTLPTPARIAPECQGFDKIPSGKLGPLGP